MADFALYSTPPVSASPLAGDGLSIACEAGGTIVHCLSAAGSLPEDRLRAALGASPCSLRAMGPGQWLLVAEGPLDAGLSARLSEAVAGVDFIDQSDGRARFRVEGANAARVLAKGAAIDFDTFETGAAAVCLFGHIAVQIARTGPEAYELIVLRSFAESLWHELEEAGAEFL